LKPILGSIQVFLKTVLYIGRNKFASINKFSTQLQTSSHLEFLQVIEFQIIKHPPITDFCLDSTCISLYMHLWTICWHFWPSKRPWATAACSSLRKR